MLAGVYTTQKKNGDTLYRASITVSDKHISLGSFSTEKKAHQAYLEAKKLLDSTKTIDDILSLKGTSVLPFAKQVSLINLRDYKMYIKTPIYLEKRFFTYYLTPDIHLKFDVDDLFYYSNHSIMKRGNHLFVADYGMQVNILSRYGIKSFAVPGRDYVFANNDDTDFRYGNIIIINKYTGVQKITENGRTYYIAKIHVNGDIIIGRYQTDTEGAIAYNKAAALLKSKGVTINYQENYIDELSQLEYVSLYNKVRISDSIRNFTAIA